MPLAGIAIISGETANINNTPNLINCDLWRILTVFPAGGQNGYQPSGTPRLSVCRCSQGAGSLR